MSSFSLRADPIATACKDTVTAMDCIRAFDSGCGALYLVDGSGRFTDPLAVTRSTFRFLWQNDGRSIAVRSPLLQVGMECSKKLEQEDPVLLAEIRRLLAEHPDWDEFPVVDESGRIHRVISKPGTPPRVFPWDTWNNIGANHAMAFLLDYAKIYVSSLEDENLRGFFAAYNRSLPVALLSDRNLAEALRDGRSLLLYAADSFPGISHKMEIQSLYHKMVNAYFSIQLKKFYIGNDVGRIRKDQLDDLPRILRLLDQGYQTLAVENADGTFYGSLTAREIARAFPSRRYQVEPKLCVPFSDDEDGMRVQAFQAYNTCGAGEIPIVRDGRTVSLAIQQGPTDMPMGEKAEHDAQPLHWQLIGDGVLRSFFRPGLRILFSSQSRDLRGLYDRVSAWASATVFDASCMGSYLAGDFDMLLYDADIWTMNTVPKYHVRTLYMNMLEEELQRYFRENSIAYYYFDRGAVSNRPFRLKLQKLVALTASVRGGRRGDYAVYADTYCRNGSFNVVGGCRATVGQRDGNRGQVHIFGPCIVTGSFAWNDGETIASRLQQKLNAASLPYNAVNYGAPNLDLGTLYRVMDTPMRSGDVVVLFGQGLHRGIPPFSLRPHRTLQEIFDAQEDPSVPCFLDDPYHMLPEGYEAVAEYLLALVREIPAATCCSAQRPVPPFSARLGTGACVRDEQLSAYLSGLRKLRVEAGRVGAIVMNCNPFTKGHLHLVQTALRHADFLYVFVVEEDRSEISFADRLAMAQENCRAYSGRLLVLPSGRWIISGRTFAEYFSKDALQEQEIHPAQDVRMFGEHIAPCLGISMRFVGREPLDNVTRQYNEAMKRILPAYGVEVMEIPRLEEPPGHAVNATEVRRLLRQGNLEACRPYLPPASYAYIATHYERIRKRMAQP